jgi:UbiD family decarboxylase
MKHFTDLRSYLDALDELGDLVRITREVDGDLESAAITRRSYELRSPAPLFENIRGAQPGFRIFGAPAGLSSSADEPYARVALSLGLPPESTGQDILDALLAARETAPVPPVLVDAATAPCRQNVLLGDEASLDRFPIPIVHENDGGRYANTWGTLIVKTPDGSWVNWSISRVMKIDGKRMTGLIIPPQHIGLIWEQWVARGEPMPFALVQGTEPAISCVSSIPLSDGANEADYLGALFGEPLELVKALTVTWRSRLPRRSSSRATCPSNATPGRARSVRWPATWRPIPRCSRPTTSRPSPTATPRSGRWSPRAARPTNATPS